MAEKAETKTINQLMRELYTATQAVWKKEDDDRNVDDIDKALKIARALMEELIKREEQMKDNLEESKLKQQTKDNLEESKFKQQMKDNLEELKLKQQMKDNLEESKDDLEESKLKQQIKDNLEKSKPKQQMKDNLGESKLNQNENPVVVQSGKTLSDVPKKSKKKLVELLETLPGSCATEDTTVMKDILALIIQSPAARALFGQIPFPVTKLLNPTSIEMSYSDASLQRELVSIVSLIAQRNDTRGKIVKECAANAMPFLIACLKSEAEIRRKAAVAISALATLDLNRKKMGESGVLKPLVKLIQEEEGDLESLRHGGRAIRFLCDGVVENRGGAVSEGAVIAVIDKVKSGILVEEMLETLVVLSEDETGIGELENGRQILENVAINGTTNAREKAANLLSRLKDLAAE